MSYFFQVRGIFKILDQYCKYSIEILLVFLELMIQYMAGEELTRLNWSVVGRTSEPAGESRALISKEGSQESCLPNDLLPHMCFRTCFSILQASALSPICTFLM